MTTVYQPNGVPLTDYERELLTILIEEAAEVTQAATKLLRFGKENRPDTGRSNSEVLGLEIGDLICLIEMIEDADLAAAGVIEDGRLRKRERLSHYMQYDEQGKR